VFSSDLGKEEKQQIKIGECYAIGINASEEFSRGDAEKEL
jgi:hypothetical protein